MSDLSRPGTIRELLERYHFGFSKALGQNFLINPTVCPRMAQASGADKTAGALEIGPGIGVLTAELAKVSKKVAAVELDERLMPVLGETLAGFDNVKIVHGDAMKIDLKSLIQDEFDGGPVAVCANLPYYITSPVIMRLLESALPITSITVMVQKEAAARLCAQPGTRQAGAISLAIRYYTRPHVLFEVSSGNFLPRPKVDSCVVRLDVRQNPPVSVRDEGLFFRVVRAAFGKRRKTVLNSISSGLSLDKARTAKAFALAGLEPSLRAEQLKLEDFAKIADAIAAMR